MAKHAAVTPTLSRERATSPVAMRPAVIMRAVLPVTIEGPQVYCERSECQDTKGFVVLDYRDDMPLEERRALALRRNRAVQLIKKSCPGKPF
jgi:hypothetical protein